MKILLTCGVGDFIAIESFLTSAETRAVDTIYWATRARTTILPLIPFVFPNVKHHVVVKDSWGEAFTEDFCVESSEDLPDLPDNVIDLSIKRIHAAMLRGTRRYRGSFLEKRQLAVIDDLQLPERYFVVHPHSENARTADRDMTAAEWTEIWKQLRSMNIPVVIINKSDKKLKQYPGVIDLTNKLDILQSIEVVKQSNGFIGSSSVFSVVASKVLARNQLYIKGHTLLKNVYSSLYYAPIEDSQQLVVQNLSRIVPMLTRFGKPRELTVNTVQGIGDIFWVYQKLAPYFDKINFNILCIKFDMVQQRSKGLVKMLPKVGYVSFTAVTSTAYSELAKSNTPIWEVLDAYESWINGEIPLIQTELSSLLIGDVPTVNYAVNAPLERGIRIDKIDPGSKLDEFVDLGLPPHVITEDYLCVFVAGAKNDDLWKPEVWVTLIDGIMERLSLKKIVLVGAEWDVPVQDEIQKLLDDHYEVTNFVNEFDLSDTLDVIRRSRFFLAYQSGLSIIADNYDVPQLMIYFKHLTPMMYSWCKQKNRDTIFQAATFADPVKNILASLKL